MIWYRDLYFWRQSVVLFADTVSSAGMGIVLSFPSLLNSAILSPNSTDIRATPDQASSIAGIQGLAGLIGFCLLPFFMQYVGRKIFHIGVCVFAGVGFLTLALARNIAALYAGRIIQAFSVCTVFASTIILAEYSDAKRRGYFITIKKGSTAVGSLICHSLGICWTWRDVAAFAIIPNIISILITFFWKESPSYLAMRGRFKECEKSYKWLHGDSPQHEKDLKDIISAQVKRRLNDKVNKCLRTTILKMFRTDYLIPFAIVSLLILIIDCSGRYYTLVYIVQILIEITGDKSIAIYCTIGSDILTVVAVISSCFIIKSFTRRQNLFCFGGASVILMYLISIITYLKSYYNIEVNVWFTPAIILLNVFIVNTGVIPICFAITSEIFPLEHKASGLFTTGIVFTLFYAAVLKFTPVLMENTGVEGTFAIFGSLNFISFVILYFILIETKDKTLQDIENKVKGVKKCSNISHSLPCEQPLMQTLKNNISY